MTSCPSVFPWQGWLTWIWPGDSAKRCKRSRPVCSTSIRSMRSIWKSRLRCATASKLLAGARFKSLPWPPLIFRVFDSIFCFGKVLCPESALKKPRQQLNNLKCFGSFFLLAKFGFGWQWVLDCF